MNASDLKGLPVVAQSDDTKIGTVDDILLNQQLRHVVGFRIKRGLLGPHSTLWRDNVTAVDANMVSVPDPSALAKVNEHAEPADVVPLDHAKGIRMITESGTDLGKVSGIHLDGDACNVISYTLAGSPLARLRRVEPSILVENALRLDGNGNIIVTDAAAEEVNEPDWKIAQGYIER
jgi:uncharacterized protein YrrD